MNYELAKQLKDAGFPLQPASMEDGKDSKRKYQIFWYGKDSIGRDGVWLYPTLSELIAACGDRFILRKGKGCWHAEQEGQTFADDKFTMGIECDGPTPEEAVANLWLALKDNK